MEPLLNYAPVSRLSSTVDGRVDGVYWTDLESGTEQRARARVVINATGPFCDGGAAHGSTAGSALVAPVKAYIWFCPSISCLAKRP